MIKKTLSIFLFCCLSILCIAQTPQDTIQKIVKPVKIIAKPLLIVDGVKMPNKTLKDLGLSHENILETQSIKAESAVKTYGEDGKNGVIVITTKNSIRDIKVKSGTSSSPVRD